MININTRCLIKNNTGVQVYLKNILKYSNCEFKNIQPETFLEKKITGHIWEQFILPLKLKNNDVLWSPSNTGPILKKKQHIITIHDIATIDHPEWTTYLFSKWYKFLTPQLLKSCSGIIAPSFFTKQRILEKFKFINENKINVIYNGVNIPENIYINNENLDIDFINIQKKINLPTNKFILNVGSLEPRKNLSNLLKSWNFLQNEKKINDDIYLIIVGKKNDKIFANVDLNFTNNNVIFTGYLSKNELMCLYKKAYLFTYLSLYEGFGLPILEAMANKIPILASNIPVFKEIFKDNCFYAEANDYLDIANNLLYLINNNININSKAENAYKLAQKLSWKASSLQTFNYLNSFL